MARLTRLSIVNQAHYVILRAIDEITLIPSEEDIGVLFDIFARISHSQHMDFSAYSLLPNQLHMLLIPRADSEDLSSAVQQISRLYSRHFGDKYSRNGSIWHGRFASAVVQGGSSVLDSIIFMEWLPFSELSVDPKLYPWTSYSHHSGIRSDYFMTPSMDYWSLGNTPFERQRKYKVLFNQGAKMQFGQKLLSSVKRGWPIAEKSLLKESGVATSRISPQRGRGRPKKFSNPSPI